jgi:hypothetical protein
LCPARFDRYFGERLSVRRGFQFAARPSRSAENSMHIFNRIANSLQDTHGAIMTIV